MEQYWMYNSQNFLIHHLTIMIGSCLNTVFYSSIHCYTVQYVILSCLYFCCPIVMLKANALTFYFNYNLYLKTTCGKVVIILGHVT